MCEHNEFIHLVSREPYEQQLKRKRSAMRAALIHFRKEMNRYTCKETAGEIGALADVAEKDMTPEQRALTQLAWLPSACEENDGLPCRLSDVIASPLVDGYRNKCEFTFGWNFDGEK